MLSLVGVDFQNRNDTKEEKFLLTSFIEKRILVLRMVSLEEFVVSVHSRRSLSGEPKQKKQQGREQKQKHREKNKRKLLVPSRELVISKFQPSWLSSLANSKVTILFVFKFL